MWYSYMQVQKYALAQAQQLASSHAMNTFPTTRTHPHFPPSQYFSVHIESTARCVFCRLPPFHLHPVQSQVFTDIII